MSLHPSPVDVAVSFTRAWTSHDLDQAAGHLADDVAYDGPVNHVVGRQAYLVALERFARIVTGLELIAALGDDEQALLMYRVTTAPFGELTCGERVTVREGRILTDELAFDTFAIRTARALH